MRCSQPLAGVRPRLPWLQPKPPPPRASSPAVADLVLVRFMRMALCVSDVLPDAQISCLAFQFFLPTQFRWLRGAPSRSGAWSRLWHGIAAFGSLRAASLLHSRLFQRSVAVAFMTFRIAPSSLGFRPAVTLVPGGGFRRNVVPESKNLTKRCSQPPTGVRP